MCASSIIVIFPAQLQNSGLCCINNSLIPSKLHANPFKVWLPSAISFKLFLGGLIEVNSRPRSLNDNELLQVGSSETTGGRTIIHFA